MSALKGHLRIKIVIILSQKEQYKDCATLSKALYFA